MTQQVYVITAAFSNDFQQQINDAMNDYLVFATHDHVTHIGNGELKYTAILFHNGARK